MPTCTATTAKGNPCKRQVREGNTLCGSHKDKSQVVNDFKPRAYPKPTRVIIAREEEKTQPETNTPDICYHSVSDRCGCSGPENTSKDIDVVSVYSDDPFDDDIGDTDDELQAHQVFGRLYCLKTENKELKTKVSNQRQYITQLQNKYEHTKSLFKSASDVSAELRRQLLLKELKHDEDMKEMNSIIFQLTTEIRHCKKELTVSEINAESYKELLKCEAFFDFLKKIRNKVCPHLADRRFHIEFFMKNKTCLDTACKMLNLEPDEISTTYFEYKTIRNKLAHPLFEGDINESIVNII